MDLISCSDLLSSVTIVLGWLVSYQRQVQNKGSYNIVQYNSQVAVGWGKLIWG